MSFSLTDLFPLALLVLMIAGAKPVKPLVSAFHDGYLSQESSQSLRGLMALVVIFTHLTPELQGGILFPLFSKVGYLAVSVFFFLSGYGLQKQNLIRENYHKGFLRKHLSGLAIPYLPAFILYWLVNILAGLPASPDYVYNEFRSGIPIVTASWYIFCIGWFYLAFWLLMRLFGKKKIGMVLGTTLFCIIFGLTCIKLNYGGWWYNTAPVLVLGVAWACWEDEILGFLSRRWFLSLIVLGVAWGVFTIGKVPIVVFLGSHWVGIALVALSGATFCGILLQLLRKVKFGNSVLSFLGGISLELYLYHNLFITLLRTKLVFISQDALYSLAVFAASIAFSFGMHRLNKWVLKRLSK